MRSRRDQTDALCDLLAAAERMAKAADQVAPATLGILHRSEFQQARKSLRRRIAEAKRAMVSITAPSKAGDPAAWRPIK